MTKPSVIPPRRRLPLRKGLFQTINNSSPCCTHAVLLKREFLYVLHYLSHPLHTTKNKT